MGCPENITSQTKEQLSANGKKGGRKSAEVRKQKRAMKDEILMILSLPVKKNIKTAATKMLTVDKAKALADFSSRNTTVQTQILLKLTQMAMSGNLKAMELIMDLSGETSDKNINVTVDNSMMEYYENVSEQLKTRHVDGVDDDD